MAVIKSPTLFFVTSPRTPAKMRPEIGLLVNRFAGLKWQGNTALQAAFMNELAKLSEFEGSFSQKNPALSARDRITRGPKALGFVALDKIAITPAGANFLDDDLSDEALLRQLMKFQLPSPFHKANPRIKTNFRVRPYLEILRLISVLGRLSFDELSLFGMQLTDYRNFDAIVDAVKRFRIKKEKRKGQYKKFLSETRRKIIADVFSDEIAKGKIKKSLEIQKHAVIRSQVTELKTFTKYNEVMKVFDGIMHKDVYDPPLAMEWNVWRAMTMMDGGCVSANLNFDDAGNPLSTAPGNTADIVCDYGDFIVTVEVTLQTGCKQYDAEGEPVARHLGDIKIKTSKDAYCLFVAPTINESSISHFYMLHHTKVKHYGGKSVIIPLTLKRFMGMLSQSKDCGYIPSPDKIKAFCEYSRQIAATAEDETEWYSSISDKAEHWLL